jgi:hypothetical protein
MGHRAGMDSVALTSHCRDSNPGFPAYNLLTILTAIATIKLHVKSLCMPCRHMRSEGISPPILDLGTGLMWVVNFMSWPLKPPGMSTQHPLSSRLCAPQSRPGRFADEKISLYPESNHSSSVVQTVLPSIPTTISWLYSTTYQWEKSVGGWGVGLLAPITDGITDTYEEFSCA